MTTTNAAVLELEDRLAAVENCLGTTGSPVVEDLKAELANLQAGFDSLSKAFDVLYQKLVDAGVVKP